MALGLNLLQFLGSLGLFLFGMKTLSEGIQRASGESLRSMLRSVTKHKILGVFTGLIFTVIIQFSTASTVVFVSFVNAELMTVFQSFSLIIGANIGTTLKGIVFAYIGFGEQIQLLHVAMILFGVAFPFYFSRNKRLKYSAEFFFGLGMVLIGLEFLKKLLPDLEQHPEIFEKVKYYRGYSLQSVSLFAIIGMLVTMMLQSSSATMIIVLVLVNKGWIDVTNAAAMVVGENIGTTLTANLAALVGNIYAKRSALFHTFFNLTGALLFLPMLLPALHFLDHLGLMYFKLPVSAFEFSDLSNKSSVPVVLAMFHILFNVTTAIVVMPILSQYEKLIEKLLPTKSDIDEKHTLQFITGGLSSTTEISIEEARNEIARFGNIIRRATRFIQNIVDEKDAKNKEELIERVAKYEEISDKIEFEVARYLSLSAEEEISVEASQQIRAMIMVIGELESIGDLCFHLSKSLERKHEQKIWFSQDQRDHLKELYIQLDKAFGLMMENLASNYDKARLDDSLLVEANINSLHDKARDYNLKMIEKGKAKLNGALIFNELLGGYEKIGNHVLRVSQVIVGTNVKRGLIGQFQD